MTIRELLNLNFEVSNVEEFFSLLYNQKIHPAFVVFSNLSINFRALEGMSVFCLELEGAIYFKLCFTDAPFLIYRFNKNLNNRYFLFTFAFGCEHNVTLFFKWVFVSGTQLFGFYDRENLLIL